MSVLWQAEVDQASCSHEWSQPFDGRVVAAVGEPIRGEWKVYCPRCGKVETRQALFTGTERQDA